MKRRHLIAALGAGLVLTGLAAPALAEDESNDPIKFCVQFPGENPRDPQAPGYCVYIPR